MKRKFISCACLSFVLVITLVSCGGAKDEEVKVETPDLSLEENQESSQDEDNGETTSAYADLDVTTVTSAEQASNEYKNLLDEYAEKVKSSSKEEAEKLKLKLDELEKYSKEKFNSSELKAMIGLTKLAVQLQSGKVVDLAKAYATYDEVLGKTFKALEDMGAGDAMEKANKSLKGATEALKNSKGYEDASKSAEDAMKKLQDAYDID